MHEPAKPGAGVHGATGAASYDVIEFSAPPVASVLFDEPSQLTVVRHLHVSGGGMAWSRSLRKRSATITLDLAGAGQFDGSVGGKRVSHPLRRGQVNFVPPDVPIELEYPASHSCLHLTLPADRLEQFIRTSGARHLEPIQAERNERMAQMIAMIDREVRDPGFASDLMVDGLTRALLTLLARHSEQADAALDRFYLPPTKLRRVLDHIEANLDGTLCLTDLASVADLSVFHFSRMFKLATGESPYHFVGSRRLARAERLLRETDMPLSELALECGFASQSHFNAAFRKALGISPGRYRREHRK